jgi:hypothetical protein
MRTTLTLEPDVAAQLKELAHRRRISFKEAVDTVLRRGLVAQVPARPKGKPRRVLTFRSAFRPGVDPAKLNQLLDELEVQEGARK